MGGVRMWVYVYIQYHAYISYCGIILFHWCYGSSTGLGIHDLINSPNIKPLVSSTNDATLKYLKYVPGLSHVLGYLIIYGCHSLPGSVT